MKFILALLLVSSCATNDVKKPQEMEAVSCRSSEVSKELIRKLQGNIKDNHKSWLEAGICYQKAGKPETARLFFDRAKSNKETQYEAIVGLSEIALRKRRYKKSKILLDQLRRNYPKKLKTWSLTAFHALNHLDLELGKLAVSKLKKFSDKKYYEIYSIYFSIIAERDDQVYGRWNNLTVGSYNSLIEESFTASYIGYLLNDKIKATKFLRTDLKKYDKRTFDQLLGKLK